MPDNEVINKVTQATTACLPEAEVARLLVHVPWLKIEVQGGRIIHPSKSIPGAWSVASVLVQGNTDVLVYADSFDSGGKEHYGLRFAHATDQWCRSHLQSARPAYSPIVDWPPDIDFPFDFTRTGPTTAELGLGNALQDSQREGEGSLVPVFWCFLRADKVGLLLFADNEIPLNVGICSVQSAHLAQQAYHTKSIITI